MRFVVFDGMKSIHNCSTRRPKSSELNYQCRYQSEKQTIAEICCLVLEGGWKLTFPNYVTELQYLVTYYLFPACALYLYTHYQLVYTLYTLQSLRVKLGTWTFSTVKFTKHSQLVIDVYKNIIKFNHESVNLVFVKDQAILIFCLLCTLAVLGKILGLPWMSMLIVFQGHMYIVQTGSKYRISSTVYCGCKCQSCIEHCSSQ